MWGKVIRVNGGEGVNLVNTVNTVNGVNLVNLVNSVNGVNLDIPRFQLPSSQAQPTTVANEH